MFVLETGSASSGTVLLLHALGLDHTVWQPQAEARYTTVSSSLPTRPAAAARGSSEPSSLGPDGSRRQDRLVP